MARLSFLALFALALLTPCAFYAANPEALHDAEIPAPLIFTKSAISMAYTDDTFSLYIGARPYTVLGQINASEAWQAIPEAAILTFTWSCDTWHHKQFGGQINLFLWPLEELPSDL